MRFTESLFMAVSALSAIPTSFAATPAYDYVIVGGGTAGMVLANRLSADPSTTVMVIEAGTDQRNNTNVTNAGGFGLAIGTDIDWNYYSVPQPQMNNRQIPFAAGKGLGGSSLINGMAFIRGDKAQFDAWEALGNTGWNWNTLYQRSKQLETFIKPTADQTAAGFTYNSAFHGTKGEVRTGPTDKYNQEPYFEVVNETWTKLGSPHIQDLNGGSVRGFSSRPTTQDPRTNYRWDAATAFLWPVQKSRPNLHILQGQVSRVIFAQGTGTRTASGVFYHYTQGGTAKTATINANKEVILSAGALKTPVIMEHSGIGNATYLEKKGLTSIIDLPGVGLTHNDQPINGIGWHGGFTNAVGNTLYTFVNAKDLFGSQFNAINASTYQALPSWAAQLSGGDPEVADALEAILRVQHGLVFKNLVTIGEILTLGSSTGVSVSYWQLMPFSRGTVHSAGKFDYQGNLISPGWFTIDFDQQVQTALGRYAFKLWKTAPANKYNKGRSHPTLSVLPDDATDAQWAAYHIDTAGTPDHSMGTCSMRSQDLLGVVSPELIVYGTKNLRIVDASVIPLQFSGHTSWLVYAVAQRAAEIILG